MNYSSSIIKKNKKLRNKNKEYIEDFKILGSKKINKNNIDITISFK